MANLSGIEKAQLEFLFQMKSNGVLDFTISTLADFVKKSVNLDYKKRAKIEYRRGTNVDYLISLWDNGDDCIVGKLLNDLAYYTEEFHTKRDGRVIDKEIQLSLTKVRTIAARLISSDISISIPKIEVETFESLRVDINQSLSRNAPEFVLDRLHTFASKMIRNICLDNKINIVKSNGEFYPLYKMVDKLSCYYAENPMLKSEFSVSAIKASVLLFTQYNDVRNDQSYTYGYDILKGVEAEYVVRIMSATISLIYDIEHSLDKLKLTRKEIHYLNDEKSTNTDNINDGFKTPYEMFLKGYDYSDIAKEFDITIGVAKGKVYKEKMEQ